MKPQPPRQSEFLPKVDARLQNIRGKIALALEVERPLSKKELWTMLYSLQGAVKILHEAVTFDVTGKRKKGKDRNDHSETD